MDRHEERPTQTKEAYEPPEVRRIKLVAEEMAAVGCKTASGPGRFTRCSFGASRCSSIGS
jgi:hypothetical protein